MLVIGFGLLCLSEFRPLVEFGLLIGLAIGTAFVVSVTLLPALVAAWKPRFVWGQANAQSPKPKVEQPLLPALLLLASLGLTGPVACSAQAPDSAPGKADPVELTAREAAMKKSLDNFRLPSEYRKLCAERQQHDRAINFFRDLAAARPENWRAHLELSCAYVDKIPTCKGITALISRGALAAKALEQADIVVSNRPNLWVSYYARGLNHLNWPRAFRHSDDAIKDLARCIEIQEQHGGQAGKPCYLRVHVALGDAYTKAGKYKEARAAWQRGVEAFPGANELKARLDTKDDNAQLAYVESQRSLDKPVDTSLAFLDEER